MVGGVLPSLFPLLFSSPLSLTVSFLLSPYSAGRSPPSVFLPSNSLASSISLKFLCSFSLFEREYENNLLHTWLDISIDILSSRNLYLEPWIFIPFLLSLIYSSALMLHHYYLCFRMTSIVSSICQKQNQSASPADWLQCTETLSLSDDTPCTSSSAVATILRGNQENAPIYEGQRKPASRRKRSSTGNTVWKLIFIMTCKARRIFSGSTSTATEFLQLNSQSTGSFVCQNSARLQSPLWHSVAR